MQQQEVSRVRSTDGRINSKLKRPIGKEQIYREKLNPHYVAGFIDGEGSFSISIGKNNEYRRPRHEGARRACAINVEPREPPFVRLLQSSAIQTRQSRLSVAFGRS